MAMDSHGVRAPSPLLDQARALLAVCAAVERFVRAPARGPALAVHEARQAQSLARSGRQSLRSLQSPLPGAWPGLLRLLADAAMELGWAAGELARFQIPILAPLPRVALLLKMASGELLKAFRSPRRGEPMLLEAKRCAGEVERLLRKARQASLEHPDAVMVLKLTAIYRRLALAAECLQDAAGAMGEVLVSGRS